MAMVASAGAPAAQAGNGDVAFSDACGDNHAYIEANDFRQELPGTARTPRYDLKGVVIAPVAGGVAASLTTCEAPGDPDGYGGWRGAYAMVSDNCQLAIVAQEAAVPGQPRVPHFTKTCFGDESQTQTPIGNTADTRFDITLPAGALTVNGDTMTITVSRAGLTGEAAAALAPGAVWTYPLGYAAENTWVGGGGGDSAGNHDSEVLPTGFDYAEPASGTTFTVQ